MVDADAFEDGIRRERRRYDEEMYLDETRRVRLWNRGKRGRVGMLP